jgi:lysophospholipase L1-like esterase
MAPVTPARAGTASSHWLTTWEPSPTTAAPDDTYLGMAFPSRQGYDQSLRMFVRVTIPGDRIRIRLSNRYGSKAITFGAVRVGLRTTAAAVRPGTSRPVTFGGRPSVTLAPGRDVVSDAVAFPLRAGDEVAVSASVVGTSGAVTWHRWANSVTYVTPAGSGDRTGEDSGSSYTTAALSWFWLAGLQQESSNPGTIVALGDSITDGWEVTPDGSQTWPDVLAARLQYRPWPLARAVVNAGIAGNRLSGPYVCGSCGEPALARLNRDVLDLPGVSEVILFEGTNDLGGGRSAAEVIAALRRVVALARQRGLRVLGATITPRDDSGWVPAMEANRVAVNQWIRTSGAYSAVFDFDAVLRDAVNPHRLAAFYDSGDGLHPNMAGLKALADSIDVAKLA